MLLFGGVAGFVSSTIPPCKVQLWFISWDQVTVTSFRAGTKIFAGSQGGTGKTHGVLGNKKKNGWQTGKHPGHLHDYRWFNYNDNRMKWLSIHLWLKYHGKNIGISSFLAVPVVDFAVCNQASPPSTASDMASKDFNVTTPGNILTSFSWLVDLHEC